MNLIKITQNDSNRSDLGEQISVNLLLMSDRLEILSNLNFLGHQHTL